MKMNESFWFKDKDGVEIFVRKWIPDVNPKAVVQLVHGGAEHVGRYVHVAEALVKAGYAVYADDHRAHGLTGIRFGKLGDLGPGGIDSTVSDLKELTDIIKKEHPDLPIFLLGHSYGSMLTKDYIWKWGDGLKGALLTGVSGPKPRVRVPRKPGDPSFAPYLSRDESVQKEYLADPLCGEPVQRSRNTSYTHEIDVLRLRITDPDIAKKIPKELPIYIFKGSEDFGGEDAAKALIEFYKDAGVKDVTYKIYPGARHELFNELNKEEVFKDTLAWLNSHL